MGLKNDFSNTVPDKKEEKREITRLAELKEDDKNTIFNLIFAEIHEEITEV